MNRTVWVASVLSSTLGVNSVDEAILAAYARSIVTRNPRIKENELRKAVSALRGLLDSLRDNATLNEGFGIDSVRFERALSVLRRLPDGAAVADSLLTSFYTETRKRGSLALAALMERMTYGVRRPLSVNEAVLPSAATALITVARKEWAAAYDRTIDRRQFAPVLDSITWHRVHSSVRANARSILDANPDLKRALDLTIGADGTIKISKADLEKRFASQVSAVTDVIRGGTDFAKRVDAIQRSIPGFLNDPSAGDALAKEALSFLSKQQGILGNASAAVFTLSELGARLKDPISGELRVSGDAIVQIGSAVARWAGLSGAAGAAVNAATKLGSAFLAGDISGAVSGIMSLFGGGSSPNEQILKEIQAVQRQVSQLREEMHSRFDRVDAKLDTIMSRLVSDFAIVHQSLETIRLNVAAVQLSVISTELRIAAYQEELRGVLTKLALDPSNNRMWDAVNARYLRSPESYAPEFEPDLAFLVRFAVAEARGASGTQAAFDAVDVINRAANVSRNLSYFISLAGDRYGLPVRAQLPVANPEVWAMGAEAWLRLASDWAELWNHLPASVRNNHFEALINAGEATDVGMRAIGMRLRQGEASSPSPLDSALTRYDTISNYVARLIEQFTDGFEDSASWGYPLYRIAGTDASKAVPSLTGIYPPVMEACDGSSVAGALEIPPSPITLLPGTLRLAVWAGAAPKPSLCYFTWSDNFVGGSRDLHLELRSGLGVWGTLSCAATIRWGTRWHDYEIIRWSWSGMNTPWDPTPFRRETFIQKCARSPEPESEPIWAAVDTTKTMKDLRVIAGKQLRDSVRQSTTFVRALQSLDGEAAVVRTFATLAFGPAIDRDDLLRALLNGPEGILTTYTILTGYDRGIPETSVEDRPRGDSTQTFLLNLPVAARQRSNALRARIAEIEQDSTAADQKHAIIAGTLDRLRAFKAEQRPPVLPPPRIAFGPGVTAAPCERAPWLTDCYPVPITAHGVRALKYVGSRSDVMNALRTSEKGNVGSSAVLRLLRRVAALETQSLHDTVSVSLKVATPGLAFFLENPSGTDRALRGLDWSEIACTVDNHLVFLNNNNKASTPESRLFEALQAVIPVKAPATSCPSIALRSRG